MRKSALFQPGDRVALVHTNDPYTRLRPGATGRVVRVRSTEVDVRWDDGSRLSMLLDEGDTIEVVERSRSADL